MSHRTRSCEQCSETFFAHDARMKYCSKACNAKACYCRRRSHVPTEWTGLKCSECDGLIPVKKKTGPQPKYCSDKCRRLGNRSSVERGVERRSEKMAAERQGRPPRPCRECDAPIPGSVSMKRTYCSAKCAKRASNRAHYARRPPCSAPDCTNQSVLAGLCRRHHPDSASWSQGNPETRRANLRRKTQKRRALIFDPAAEDICRDEIGERDGWICGLCSEPVDRTLPWPDSLSASLDHILPLSLGGRHVASNVQISHLTCNVRKGNRVGDTTQSRDAAA